MSTSHTWDSSCDTGGLVPSDEKNALVPSDEKNAFSSSARIAALNLAKTGFLVENEDLGCLGMCKWNRFDSNGSLLFTMEDCWGPRHS